VNKIVGALADTFKFCFIAIPLLLYILIFGDPEEDFVEQEEGKT
jgi:hypothetical protein